MRKALLFSPRASSDSLVPGWRDLGTLGFRPTQLNVLSEFRFPRTVRPWVQSLDRQVLEGLIF